MNPVTAARLDNLQRLFAEHAEISTLVQQEIEAAMAVRRPLDVTAVPLDDPSRVYYADCQWVAAMRRCGFDHIVGLRIVARGT